MNRYFAILAALALGACTQLPGINDQGYAGITDVAIEWCKTSDAAATSPGTAIASAMSPGKGYALCGVKWKDGKEKQNVHLSADMVKGTIDYSASGVLAFDGQRARAAVEQVLAQAQVQGSQVIAPAIVNAIEAALGIPPTASGPTSLPNLNLVPIPGVTPPK